mmetsp:Transcript_44320/g.115180  ORF Transcript_44320/g.115180 Transcript_44320/m.115180 type:complete len:309 (-) Transcript_44320:2389-3315(-)
MKFTVLLALVLSGKRRHVIICDGLRRKIHLSQDLMSELRSLIEVIEEVRAAADEKERKNEMYLRTFRDPRRSFIEVQLQEYISELRQAGVPRGGFGERTKEGKIITYILGERPASRAGDRQSPRPPLGGIRPHSSPLRPSTARSSALGGRESVLLSPRVSERLNIDQVEEVASILRELIVQEGLELEQDVEYLRLWLEDEHEQCEEIAPPPDMPDLEALRKGLEDKIRTLRITSKVEPARPSTAILGKQSSLPSLVVPRSPKGNPSPAPIHTAGPDIQSIPPFVPRPKRPQRRKAATSTHSKTHSRGE